MAENDNVIENEIRLLDVSKIRPINNLQDRSDLDVNDDEFINFAASINDNGLQQPICVYKIPDYMKKDGEDYEYNIIYGARRLKAHIFLKLDKIKGIIKKDNLHPYSIILSTWLENEKRKDLNQADQAVALMKALAIFFDQDTTKEESLDIFKIKEKELIRTGLNYYRSASNIINKMRDDTGYTLTEDEVNTNKKFNEFISSLNISLSTLQRRIRILSFGEAIITLIKKGMNYKNADLFAKIKKNDEDLYRKILYETFSKKKVVTEGDEEKVKYFPVNSVDNKEASIVLKAAMEKFKKRVNIDQALFSENTKTKFNAVELYLEKADELTKQDINKRIDEILLLIKKKEYDLEGKKNED